MTNLTLYVLSGQLRAPLERMRTVLVFEKPVRPRINARLPDVIVDCVALDLWLHNWCTQWLLWRWDLRPWSVVTADDLVGSINEALRVPTRAGATLPCPAADVAELTAAGATGDDSAYEQSCLYGIQAHLRHMIAPYRQLDHAPTSASAPSFSVCRLHHLLQPKVLRTVAKVRGCFAHSARRAATDRTIRDITVDVARWYERRTMWVVAVRTVLGTELNCLLLICIGCGAGKVRPHVIQVQVLPTAAGRERRLICHGVLEQLSQAFAAIGVAARCCCKLARCEDLAAGNTRAGP